MTSAQTTAARDAAPENAGEKVGRGSGGMSPLRAA